MKLVINRQFGGFGLSEAAYTKLHEYGVPIQSYVEPERDPVTHLYKPQPLNDGEVIFDRALSSADSINEGMTRLCGRYWDLWTRGNRTHPHLVRVVEELGAEASGRFADLRVVEIPDGIAFTIEEYDGREHVAEVHRTWGDA